MKKEKGTNKMKKWRNRTGSILLLVVLLFGSLLTVTSCHDSAGINQVTTADDETTGATTEPTPWEALPDRDMNGYRFRVLMMDDAVIIADMFQESETSDNVQSEIRNRNLAVEARYDVTLECFPNNDLVYNVAALIQSSDNEFDLILPHARFCGLYASEGYLIDWNDIPVIDLKGEWWDQNANASLSIFNKVYYTTGDISYWSYGSTVALLFNKELMDDLQMDYPYQIVKDRAWTLEVFEEMAKAGAGDLNGDGIFRDLTNDRFGYITDGFLGDVQTYYATGNTVISKDDEGIPYISYYSERAENVWQWFSSFMEEDACYFSENAAPLYETDAIVAFMENRCLFMHLDVRRIAYLRSMDTDFGIIPSPTYQEGDPYLANVGAGMHLFAVPTTVIDKERTGIVLEALAILGRDRVIPEYKENTVWYKQTRDEESREMLDLIFAGRVYDLGYYNVEMTGAVGKDETIANSFRALMGLKSKSMMTVWSQYQSSAEAYLERYLDIIADLNDA